MKRFLIPTIILAHFISVLIYYFIGTNEQQWTNYYYCIQQFPIAIFALLIAFYKPRVLFDKISCIFEFGFSLLLCTYNIVFDYWESIWIMYKEFFLGFLLVYVFSFLIVAVAFIDNYKLMQSDEDQES